MQKMHACLWFNNDAEEAANFYARVFKGKVLSIDRVPEGVPGMPAGQVITAFVEILGQPVMLLNGGPGQEHNWAFSYVINTDDQAETDYYWEALTADGGAESQCGWLNDRFGVFWQITPKRLSEMNTSSDRAAAGRAMQAMLKMKKIIIADLETAFAGKQG
jgi:predicted 3-demethylubiquinone-9 3-methyltransferase (glyoxalase superfamily)